MMNDSKSSKLQKRIKTDQKCTILITGLLGIITLLCLCGVITSIVTPKEGQQSFAIGLGSTVEFAFILVNFIILSFFITDIKKTGRPFTLKNTNRLRVIAVITMLAGVLPEVVTSIAGMFDPTAVFQLELNVTDFFIILLGAVFGILSEIFHYGYELQEDMDSIA